MSNRNTDRTRTLFAAFAAFALIVATGRCQAAPAKDAPKPAVKEAAKEAPKEAAKPAAKDAGKAGQTVEMKVTDKGFEPANVTVKKDQPVTLVITRVTERTCATEIVIDDYGVNTKLPLNTPVNVIFTPKKTGDLKYGCAMGKMIGGVLKIQ
jgi:plastocyanin domain-containing protein